MNKPMATRNSNEVKKQDRDERNARFGNAVRAMRLAKGSISLRGMAARMEVTSAYLSRIERGLDAPPSNDRLRTMARILNSTYDDMVLLAGRIPDDIQATIHANPAIMCQFIRLIGRMDKAEASRLLDQATEIVRNQIRRAAQ